MMWIEGSEGLVTSSGSIARQKQEPRVKSSICSRAHLVLLTIVVHRLSEVNLGYVESQLLSSLLFREGQM